MKRRAFLAGMVAAPIAAQLPLPALDAAALDVPITAAEVIGNRLLTADVVAAEALRILKHNAFYVSLSNGELDVFTDDDFDDE